MPERHGPGEIDPADEVGTEPRSAAVSEILASAGLRAAVREGATTADLEPTLQALVDEYGRASGASAVFLATGDSKATSIGGRWIYEATDKAADTADGAILEGLARQLREQGGSPLDPAREIVWRSREDGGSTCDFIGSPVRAADLPTAALCAALIKPADPPDAAAAVTRDFAALASLCMLAFRSREEPGGEPDAGPSGTRPACLDAPAIKQALASELSRCGLSKEALSLCFVDTNGTPSNGRGSQNAARLIAVLGQVLAEAGQPYDFVGMLEDGEFLIVMPGADHLSGVATARYLMRVARLTLGATRGEGAQPVFRVAEWDRSEDADALLRRGRTEVRGEG